MPNNNKYHNGKKGPAKKTSSLPTILFIAFVLIVAVIAIILVTHTSSPKTTSIDLSTCYTTKLEPVDHPTNYVQIEVENGAYIVVELDPESAPITVANFQKLVSEGFFNGLVFHRVYKNFMIQGGGFKPDGTQVPAESIKGEFSANGVENNISHKRGVISMARATNKDSASSQFFICHQDALHLDGQYAAFGWVVAGMETVDTIANVAVDKNEYGEKTAPVTPVIITNVSFVDYSSK